VNIKPARLIRNAYIQSLLIHAVLIIILALMIIKPQIPHHWHVFEWEISGDVEARNEQSSKGIIPNSPSEVADIASTITSAGDLQTSEPAIVTSNPKLIESPVIEAPSTSFSENNTTNRKRNANPLLSIGNTIPGGNSGFSADMEMGNGDAYIIQQAKPNITPTMDGEVLIEFKLSNRGSVDTNSVKILSFSSTNYVEAVQKVLPQWQFGFKGAYQADRLYRIRCRFVVDE
jgi:hypothetical protein